jgi:multimeric flavodoxin WrbA
VIITLLNGNSDPAKPQLDAAVDALARRWRKRGHAVESILLRERRIDDCIGCFGCWVKTPGRCVHDDDMTAILRSVILSDRVVFASDLRFAMLSPLTLSTLNRFLPLGCAYLRLDSRGRTAHFPRYELRWKTGLLVEDRPGLTAQALADLAYSFSRGNRDRWLGVWRVGRDDEEAFRAVDCD